MRIDVLSNIIQHEYVFYVPRKESDFIAIDSSILHDLEKNNYQILKFGKQVIGVRSNGF